MSVITNPLLHTALSYEAYIQLSNQLYGEGKTTGPNQTEALVNYTGLNLKRMNRLQKTTHLEDETLKAIESVREPQIWLVLTEAWCGDAAQILPVLSAMAEANPLIDMRILLRDDNPGIMDVYLTNGARAIPKLIVLDSNTLEELGQWGPRPSEAQEIMVAYKQNPNRPYAELMKELQIWYNRDKTATVQQEVSELIRSIV